MRVYRLRETWLLSSKNSATSAHSHSFQWSWAAIPDTTTEQAWCCFWSKSARPPLRNNLQVLISACCQGMELFIFYLHRLKPTQTISCCAGCMHTLTYRTIFLAIPRRFDGKIVRPLTNPVPARYEPGLIVSRPKAQAQICLLSWQFATMYQ